MTNPRPLGEQLESFEPIPLPLPVRFRAAQGLPKQPDTSPSRQRATMLLARICRGQLKLGTADERTVSAAPVSAGLGGMRVGADGGAAALASPGFASFLHGDRSDDQAGEGVGP